ncbi:MAG: dTDP-4-amino-4,6-dideoxygalactose transaminase [Pseudomonadota bacterium]
MSAIPFHIAPQTGSELQFLADVFKRGKISGDGYYSRLCQDWFKNRYHFPHTLLTTSCTDALEMAALLCPIEPGDEVIAPSYTFVSTVNAFALRGAHIRFADSQPNHPNINLDEVESLITPRTRALIVVHYAGMACDMNKAQALCKRYNLKLIEDAAQAIDAYYYDSPLGSLSDYATFSFHDTKNVIAGEGGLLVVNRQEDQLRAEIIREKGTNRSAFLRGEIDKYTWVDIGSSYLPSELNAAVLWAQLQAIDASQHHRHALWQHYYESLAELEAHGVLQRPHTPAGAKHNAHIFYIIAPSLEHREKWALHLKQADIATASHYNALHNSHFYRQQQKEHVPSLPHSERYTDTLLRLPLYNALTHEAVDRVINTLKHIL